MDKPRRILKGQRVGRMSAERFVQRTLKTLRREPPPVKNGPAREPFVRPADTRRVAVALMVQAANDAYREAQDSRCTPKPSR